MKASLIVGVVAGGAVLAGAVAVTAQARDGSASPSSVAASGQAQGANSSKASRAAESAYDSLTRAYPDDFGFVFIDDDSGDLTVPVVTDRGRTLLASMQRGQAPEAASRLPGEGDEGAAKRQESLVQAAREVGDIPVVAVTTSRSRAAIEADANRIIDESAEAPFAEAGIWATGPDPQTGRVVVTAANPTKAMEDALAAKYGADNITIETEPNSGLTTL